jgi:CubicO group peptidase (beta-lactamase class C family)
MAFSQVVGGKPAAPPQSAPVLRAMTAADLEAFLDGVVPLQIERADIAGVVVAVVKDGHVLFEKGYGYADVKAKKPVSATDTLFRPGSISKLFIWTSVMQMVEQGKLDLDRDVNGYLDFKIPDAFGQPITMRNIMTHTAGFEEAGKDLFVPGPEDTVPLNVYLSTHIPTRIFPAGTTPAYSNYGAAMAGYIVQRVSGEPLHEYIAAHILKPLDMTHSTFDQPLPAALKPLMSSGYSNAGSPARPFEVVNAWPAGSLSASADDMTRFMVAHLQDGEYQGARILKPETARLMHARQFTTAPEMNGMALGFYEETHNGHRIIGHGGNTRWFHSDLHLVSDLGLGFFVSYNSTGRIPANNREELWYAILDRYYPFHSAARPTAATASADADIVSGSYLTTRRSDTSVLKMGAIFGETKVSRNISANGAASSEIVVSDLKGPNGELKKWREIGPLLYQETGGQALIAFRRNFSGRLEMVTDFPVYIFQRVGPFEDQATIQGLLIFALTIFAFTLLGWPAAGCIRRHYGRALSLGPVDRRMRIITRLVCLVDVVVVGLWMESSSIGVLSRHDARLYLLEAFGLAAAIATLLVFYDALRAWRDPQRWLWSRIWESLIAAACLSLVWVAATLNLIFLNARY